MPADPPTNNRNSIRGQIRPNDRNKITEYKSKRVADIIENIIKLYNVVEKIKF